jgi:PKD repeat protein
MQKIIRYIILMAVITVFFAGYVTADEQNMVNETVNRTNELTAPLTVKFTDTSANSPDNWNWTFGDGSVSGVNNPQYTYAVSGNFTVLLTAGNSGGYNTTTKRIAVPLP